MRLAASRCARISNVVERRRLEAKRQVRHRIRLCLRGETLADAGRRRRRSSPMRGRRPGGAAPSAASLMRRPIGSSPPKCIAANRWLTMAASCPAVPSTLVEQTPAHELRAEGLEVSRPDRDERHNRRLLAGRAPGVLRPAAAGSDRRRSACWSRPSRRLDTAEPGDALVEPVVERLSKLRRRILLVRQREAHREEVRRLDPQIEPVERQEAAHHEAGPGEQHQRQRQLDDDERAGPASGAHAAAATAAAVLQAPRSDRSSRRAAPARARTRRRCRGRPRRRRRRRARPS